jgi:hypothetical protein
MSNDDWSENDLLPWSSLIRFTRNLLAIGAAIVLGFFLLGTLYQSWYGFKGEKWAKRVVTGNDLQAWALKVLADPQNKVLKTNYPAELRDMYPGDLPIVLVSGTNYPPASVCIAWGHIDWMAGFEIGPTNFVCGHLNAHEWQPGVYWFHDH